MFNRPAILALADGTILEGLSVGASGDCVGELVFNTAMTGYQEIMSDPSYSGQVIVFTTPHIGNTGCNEEDMESSRAWASGVVMRECSLIPSNYRATHSLPDWLKKHGIVAIAGVDTRQLTLLLRENGALGCCISTDTENPEKALTKAREFPGFEGKDLAIEVSRKTIERWDEGRKDWGPVSQPLQYHVVAYDFGVKHMLLRIMHNLGCHITLVPAQTTAEEALALNPDGIFLSNGPGDPLACDYAITATQVFLKKEIPLLGICLGFQILALAAGAKTSKMKFGHHGANHPVLKVTSPSSVFITSQNHGFAVEEASLPACFEVTHRSLFDKSLQGIRHKSKPAFGFQGHPEASPGPHDIEVLFDEFVLMMAEFKKREKSE